jgi:hypothetical protein
MTKTTNAQQYDALVVYPYRSPGTTTARFAVATDDRPESIVHRTASKAAAVKWAEKRSANVAVSS